MEVKLFFDGKLSSLVSLVTWLVLAEYRFNYSHKVTWKGQEIKSQLIDLLPIINMLTRLVRPARTYKWHEDLFSSIFGIQPAIFKTISYRSVPWMFQNSKVRGFAVPPMFKIISAALGVPFSLHNTVYITLLNWRITHTQILFRATEYYWLV